MGVFAFAVQAVAAAGDPEETETEHQQHPPRDVEDISSLEHEAPPFTIIRTLTAPGLTIGPSTNTPTVSFPRSVSVFALRFF